MLCGVAGSTPRKDMEVSQRKHFVLVKDIEL